MFRDTKFSKIDTTNFGAGSFVQDGNQLYLVAANGKSVGLIDLLTFQTVGVWVQVVDPNFLAESEARALCNNIEGATFSDHELITTGLKEFRLKASTARGVGITRM